MGGVFALSAQLNGGTHVYFIVDSGAATVQIPEEAVEEMKRNGTLTEAEAELHPQANVITRAVGAEGELELDKVTGRAVAGDVFLLCSDGLFKAIAEDGIAGRLRDGVTAEALIEAAVAEGARDNVTAIIVRVGE